MAYIEDPRFPDDISAGSTFGPEWGTRIARLPSGKEQRDQPRALSLRKGTVGHEIQDQTEFNKLLDFFEVAEGMTHVWRFKDWTDFNVSSARGRLGDLSVSSAAAIGHGKPDYQLYKRYVNSSNLSQNPKDRLISKPVSAQISVYRNGSLVAFGASSGNIACDTTTGKITFVADVIKNISSISRANPGVVVSSGHGYVTGNVIYIRTAGGMTQVNSLAFTIVSATTSTWILSGTDTSSYTAYTGAGIAERYAQSSESIHWTGQFDVPCRFATDHMAATVQLINNQSWPGIQIMEVRT